MSEVTKHVKNNSKQLATSLSTTISNYTKQFHWYGKTK